MASIFITGNSNGLGLGLTRHYLEQQHQVYSLSRSDCPISDPNLHHRQQDLTELAQIPAALQALLPQTLDLVILNAGILGEIKDLSQTSMDEVEQLMTTNVWQNKIIVDWLIHNQRKVKQIIFMSSGASVNGNRGWGMYSVSKASLNMMAKLYAEEMPDTHITAYAPGLVQTRMQDYLCHDVDCDQFPSIKNLVGAYQTEMMPDIDSAAKRIASSFKACLKHVSGSFLDIRSL